VAAGPYTLVWNNGANDVAEFNQATGTITLGADVTVGGINAKTGASGNTIAEGAGPYTITLGVSGNNTINTAASVTAGRTLNVNAVIAGASGANLVLTGPGTSGAGTVSLGRANTFAGTTSFTGNDDGAINLTLRNQFALQNSTLTLSVDCNALTFDSSVVANAFTFGGLAGSEFDFALENNAVTPAAIALSVGNNDATTGYSGVMSGAGSLTKIGSGLIQLNGSNTYTGPTLIQEGNLNLGAGLAGGKLSTSSTITIETDAGFGIFQNDAVIQGTDFSGAPITGGGDFYIVGSPTVTLNAANNYTGSTTISGGLLKHEGSADLTLTPGNLTFDGNTTTSTPFNIYNGVLGLTSDFTRALGTGDNQVQWIKSGGFAAFGADRTVSLNGGGNVAWNAGSFVPSSRGLVLGHTTATHKVTFSNNINFNNSNLRVIQVDNGPAAVDAAISGTLGISGGTLGGFVKTGNGTLELTNQSLYTGTTTLSAGTLILNNANALGTTPGVDGTSSIAMAAGTTLRSDYIIADAGNVDSFVYAPITLSGTGSVNFHPGAGSSVAPAEAVTFNLNGAIGGTVGTNVVFSTPSANLGNADSIIVLGAASTYDGNTTITAGNNNDRINVKAGVPNALPTTTVLTLGNKEGAGTFRTMQYDLNGNNQTLAGLDNGGNVPLLRRQTVTNSSLTPATLTINNAADFIFGGANLNAVNSSTTRAQITGNLALVKSGAGTLTLGGTLANDATAAGNTYSGNTTVNEGILRIGFANPSNESSTVTIAESGATLDLTYSGTDTVDKLFIGDTQLDAGVYGPTATSIPQITNSTGTGTLTVTSGPGGGGFSAWQSANSTLGGIDEDHDGDGVSNGIEFFIYGPVAKSGFTALPPVDDDGGVLSVTWTKAAGYTGTYGTHYVVETSATLADPWVPQIANPDPGFTVTFPSATEVKYTFPAGTRNFARLKVTGP
jgi:autotransporter-associated beta strand protein